MNIKYSFDDVLLVPQYSDIMSRGECSVCTTIGGLSMGIPIFAANMDTICGVNMIKGMRELGGYGILHRYMKVSEMYNTIVEWGKNNEDPIIVALGSMYRDLRRIDIACEEAEKSNVILCVDIANGDSKNMIDTLEYIRENKSFGGTVIAGNVSTFDGATRLFTAGADIVKVGVGPGSVCTTRLKTGCGYPQFAAIQECSKAGPIIADGGIRHPGDAAKALAAGAKAVMLGGMLAGTDMIPNWDSPSCTSEFRGMASMAARAAIGAPVTNAEGVKAYISKRKKGSTRGVIDGVVEGIKSAMSYTGCRTLEEFSKNPSFILGTQAMITENGPHINGDRYDT